MAQTGVTSKLADPYASALLNLALTANEIERVTANLDDFGQILENNEGVGKFLSSPLHSLDNKVQVLSKVIASEEFHPTTEKFLKVLIERKRINIFDDIYKRYLNLLYEMVDLKVAEITSAYPLTTEQESVLESALGRKYKAREVKLITSVDKKLLGGLTIKVGSNVVDLSIRGQLEGFANALETTLF